MTEPSRRRSTKKIGPAPRRDQDARPGQPFPPDQHASAEVADHAIEAGSIHPNVHYICRRLADHGHLALLVGGAVRDLLLGIRPKDFDLATSARPEEVERLFRNARIIGRRFRLVLVRYPDMLVEIATFRAEPGRLKNGMILRDNRYGTMEEDVRRRDFTINALTLDPLEGKLYDFVGAMDDLRAGIIRTIKPPEDSYREDPVRMLRAVRFQCRLGLKIDPECQRAIPPAAKLLGEVSRHRLADELQRLGYALVIFPGGAVRALAATAQRYYASLLATGSNAAMSEAMFDFSALQELLGTAGMLARGEAYDPEAD